MKIPKVQIKDKIQRIEQAIRQLSDHQGQCSLCPRECGIDRSSGESGFCGGGMNASVSHALLHFGEEPVLSGYQENPSDSNHRASAGSGAVFFSGCNLKCLFCQNYQLSWFHQGKKLSSEKLSEILIGLQEKGALNINFVSPMHMILPLLEGLKKAYERGLCLPIVYNTNAYEKVTTLRYLDGIVDIYLPDLKFHSSQLAQNLCNTPDYFVHAGPAVKEMLRQRPEIRLNRNEVAREGVIIRHLVLPGQVSDSLAILDWIAKNISTKIGLSLMSQYVSCFKAPEEIRKPLTEKEYEQVASRAEELGVDLLFLQPDLFDPDEHLVPDFDQKNPFKWE
jgi:putative pyruvate formate lyase activating enzyme